MTIEISIDRDRLDVFVLPEFRGARKPGKANGTLASPKASRRLPPHPLSGVIKLHSRIEEGPT
jgi:hypothetical protein